MTHDEMIEVIQAHKDGKVIQRRVKAAIDSKFKDRHVKHVFMDFATHDYRIKPEPKEYWLLPYLDGSGFKVLSFNTKRLTSNYCDSNNLNLSGSIHVVTVDDQERIK
jgi:hypothetical protein